ncbi:MAG: hypothetical protein NkDv07_0738 [Candidatus Improbicoccus devescovinae]|nr:MAG: hypothetical protein NkDv07_0738 [Candidatus Improbicoccus devescovinae]
MMIIINNLNFPSYSIYQDAVAAPNNISQELKTKYANMLNDKYEIVEYYKYPGEFPDFCEILIRNSENEEFKLLVPKENNDKFQKYVYFMRDLSEKVKAFSESYSGQIKIKFMLEINENYIITSQTGAPLTNAETKSNLLINNDLRKFIDGVAELLNYVHNSNINIYENNADIFKLSSEKFEELNNLSPESHSAWAKKLVPRPKYDELVNILNNYKQRLKYDEIPVCSLGGLCLHSFTYDEETREIHVSLQLGSFMNGNIYNDFVNFNSYFDSWTRAHDLIPNDLLIKIIDSYNIKNNSQKIDKKKIKELIEICIIYAGKYQIERELKKYDKFIVTETKRRLWRQNISPLLDRVDRDFKNIYNIKFDDDYD